ncbi:hypothetical protein [Methylobacterium nodulans]|uniref:Uncharacterized protein n=1 Tax=Methylobacterium nodulans (strain LMG 21967 / CNCM I-2342 / ORS 2060) TaxID=460265 RepID=B8IRE5_METNO|nr:hypothetical protein [Methylobacterium nodulans]ACL58685.1 conserved hypothetical protein [Methylobacterium nodulans ORS 2060]
MIARALFALLLLSTAATAQDYNRQDLVRGLCQPDGCDEFQVLTVEPMLTGTTGALKRTQVKTFHASYSGRMEREPENGFVYCSLTKPAIMAQGKGRTVAFMLAPFATEDNRETIRKNANFVAMYFAICHGPDIARRAVQDLRSTASSLGYRVTATASRMVNLKSPDEIVDRQIAAPVAATPAPAAPPRRREASPGLDLLPPAEIPED